MDPNFIRIKGNSTDLIELYAIQVPNIINGLNKNAQCFIGEDTFLYIISGSSLYRARDYELKRSNQSGRFSTSINSKDRVSKVTEVTRLEPAKEVPESVKEALLPVYDYMTEKASQISQRETRIKDLENQLNYARQEADDFDHRAKKDLKELLKNTTTELLGEQGFYRAFLAELEKLGYDDFYINGTETHEYAQNNIYITYWNDFCYNNTLTIYRKFLYEDPEAGSKDSEEDFNKIKELGRKEHDFFGSDSEYFTDNVQLSSEYILDYVAVDETYNPETGFYEPDFGVEPVDEVFNGYYYIQQFNIPLTKRMTKEYAKELAEDLAKTFDLEKSQANIRQDYEEEHEF